MTRLGGSGGEGWKLLFWGEIGRKIKKKTRQSNERKQAREEKMKKLRTKENKDSWTKIRNKGLFFFLLKIVLNWKPRQDDEKAKKKNRKVWEKVLQCTRHVKANIENCPQGTFFFLKNCIFFTKKSYCIHCFLYLCLHYVQGLSLHTFFLYFFIIFIIKRPEHAQQSYAAYLLLNLRRYFSLQNVHLRIKKTICNNRRIKKKKKN